MTIMWSDVYRTVQLKKTKQKKYVSILSHTNMCNLQCLACFANIMDDNTPSLYSLLLAIFENYNNNCPLLVMVDLRLQHLVHFLAV